MSLQELILHPVHIDGKLMQTTEQDDDNISCMEGEVKTTWEQQQEQELSSTVEKKSNIRRSRSSVYGTASNATTKNLVEQNDEASLDDRGTSTSPKHGHEHNTLFMDHQEDGSVLSMQGNSSHEKYVSEEVEEPVDLSDAVLTSKSTEQGKVQQQQDVVSLYSSLTELTADLVEAVDHLFHQVDRDVVTVKTFHKQLEEALGLSMPKNLKALVKQRLLGLLTGDIKSSSEKDDGSFASDEKSITSDEEEQEEEEEWGEHEPIKKRKLKPKKKGENALTKRSSRKPRAIRSKKSSLVGKQLKTIRQKQAEEEKVWQEELAGAGEQKLHEEDVRRQEAIAARFESGQEETKIMREQHRRGVLEKLLLKKRSVLQLTDEDFQQQSTQLEQEVEKASIKDSAESVVSSGNSTDSSDSELDIIPPSRSSTVDRILGCTGFNEASPILQKTSALTKTGTASTTSRAALRNSLRSKAIRAGNTWLARELGYKSQEEHLKDCRQAELQRKEVLRKQEVKKQIMISESLLKENSYLTDFIPDDENESEEDEEMQLAEEIAAEKHALESSQLVSDDPLGDESQGFEYPDNESRRECVLPEVMDGSQLVSDDPFADESQFVRHRTMGESQLLDDDSFVDESQFVRPQISDGSQLVSDEPLADEPQLACDHDESQFHRPQLTDGSQLVSDEPDDSLLISNESMTCSTALISPNQSNGLEDDGTSSPLTYSDNRGENTSENPTDSKDSANANKKIPREPKDRAKGWKTILLKEAEELKQKKKLRNRSVSGMIEEEAEEEEDDVAVGGLEDFGFGVINKKKDKDEEEDLEIAEEVDLEGIVDDLSDGEGDEEEGAKARKLLQEKEEKEQHKEILRRMRDGYDGRRGGIAAGGARGVHRFDELVAADDRGEAKRLGLLNDDELDSDEERAENDDDGGNVEEEDEAMLIDKMLKDRFLNRTDEDMLFSDNDSEEGMDDLEESESQLENENEREEVLEQMMEKRFAKNARRNRVIEIYGDSLLGSESRIIDEDESLRNDLKTIQTLSKKRSIASSDAVVKRPFFSAQGSLSIALMASRQKKKKTSFLSGKSPTSNRNSGCSVVAKSVSLTHVVFQSSESQHASQFENSSRSRSCFASTQCNTKKKRFGVHHNCESLEPCFIQWF